MAAFSIVREEPKPGSPLYRLKGAFGPAEAWQVVRRLRAEADRSRIAVDLGQLSNRSDLALYVLAHDLPIQERHGRRLVLRGLREHDLRLLRYLCAEELADSAEG